MKVLIVGDQHFKVEMPYAAAFSDGRRGEWISVLETIHKTAKKCDAVVLMGDNLNTRHNHSTVIKDFIDFLKGFGDKPIHILVGNHEKYGESSALDFLEKIKYPNWNVYTSITNGVDIGRRAASFVPYLTPSMLGVANNKTGATKAIKELTGGDYVFLHQGITGAKTSGGLVDLFNEIVISKAALEKKYNFIASGHIHKAQKLSDKTLMTGSIKTMEVGEHEKFIWILDTDDHSVKEVPLPVRGIYGVSGVDVKPPKNSIVKCTVTDPKTDIEHVKTWLSQFDAGILVEKYPRERRKVHFEKGGFDLSLDNLVKVFAKTRGIEHNDLKDGLDIIET